MLVQTEIELSGASTAAVLRVVSANRCIAGHFAP